MKDSNDPQNTELKNQLGIAYKKIVEFYEEKGKERFKATVTRLYEKAIL